MVLTLVISLIMIYILLSYKIKTFKNIMTFLIIFWSLNLIVSKYFMPNFFEVSNKTYVLLLTYVFSILIGFFLFSRGVPKITNNDISPIDIRVNDKESNLIFLLKLVLFCVVTFYLITYLNTAKFLPTYMQRTIRFEIGLLFKSPIELLFFNYIISSLVELFGVLSIVRFVLYKEVNFSFVISISTLILYTFIGYGRFGLFNAMIFIMSAMVFATFFRKEDIKTRNSNIKLFVLMALFFGVMIIIGYKRGINEGSLMQGIMDSINQFFQYFSGPHRALDNFIQKYDTIPLFGRAFFSGVDEIIIMFLSLFGFDIQTANQIISNITATPILIGDNSYFNAFYTGVFNSFLDGGVVMVVIEGFALGSISAYIWNRAMKYRNIYSLAILVFLNLVLISTGYRFELQQFKSFAILAILFLMQRRYYNEKGQINNCSDHI